MLCINISYVASLFVIGDLCRCAELGSNLFADFSQSDESMITTSSSPGAVYCSNSYSVATICLTVSLLISFLIITFLSITYRFRSKRFKSYVQFLQASLACVLEYEIWLFRPAFSVRHQNATLQTKQSDEARCLDLQDDFGNATKPSLNENISECEHLKRENVEQPRKKEHTLVHVIEADVAIKLDGTRRCQELQDKLDSVETGLTATTSEFDHLKDEHDAIVEQLKKKIEELELVTEERDQAREQLISTEQELEHTKVMQDKIIQLELTKAELQYACNFQAEVEHWKTQLKSKSVQLVRAETTIVFLEREINELRKKLEEYEDINREILAEHVGSPSSKQQPTSCSEEPLVTVSSRTPSSLTYQCDNDYEEIKTAEDEEEMSSTFKHVFIHIRVKLKKTIQVTDVLLEEIMKRGILDGRDVASIKAEQSEGERVERLLTLLERCEREQLSQLYASLNAAGQSEVVKVLREG